MYKSLSTVLASSVLFAGSAFAGEIGVTNSYGHSVYTGTGSRNVEWKTNSQLTEQSAFGAIKLETSSFNQGSGHPNNGHGNGDQTPPGNSGQHNNAENAGGGSLPNLADGFTDRAFAASFSFGTRNYTEETKLGGNSSEVYTFGTTNFTHSVGAFSR